MVNEALLEEGVKWARLESKKPSKLREWLQNAWIVDFAKVKPEDAEKHWNRGTACGTAGCIAGWAVVVSGEKLGKPNALGHIEETKDGKLISDRAKELLGLTSSQADRLFMGSNTLEDIERIAEEILGEKV